jgi:hypothetical protein
MRRMLTGLLALWLAAAGVVALAPATLAADSAFAGTWTSIDTDGSTQALAVGHGSSPSVTYLDFSASSCINGGAPSSQFVATGRGTIDGASLWVDFRDGGCGRHRIGPFGLGFAYDAGSDTLTDDFGITWFRYP